ncbi:hypothetical protein XENOCAPTIV_009145 [Xenoophorus captivus]|uniref:Uncharacterized protein n=1 Tax=Xenoophorus captivus TaxID=1517983 RepID=A0ABV0S2M3_9TELE
MKDKVKGGRTKEINKERNEGKTERDEGKNEQQKDRSEVRKKKYKKKGRKKKVKRDIWMDTDVHNIIGNKDWNYNIFNILFSFAILIQTWKTLKVNTNPAVPLNPDNRCFEEALCRLLPHYFHFSYSSKLHFSLIKECGLFSLFIKLSKGNKQ